MVLLFSGYGHQKEYSAEERHFVGIASPKRRLHRTRMEATWWKTWIWLKVGRLCSNLIETAPPKLSAAETVPWGLKFFRDSEANPMV